MFETVSVDDVIGDALTEAVSLVGARTYLTAPLVVFDPKCFPDPWEPTLQGVRTALRRFLRYVGLGNVPVRVTDERATSSQDGPVVDPIAFAGIKNGIASFDVYAIDEPEFLAAWMCIEVVRAWAEHHGVTRDTPLAYRAIPSEDVPPQPDTVLDASSATVVGIALGLGPVLAAGSVQSHKREKVSGAWVETQWSRAVVGGFPPPVLARVLAIYALTRAAGDDEREVLRASLPPDSVPDFDAAIEELGDNAVSLRARLGLPAEIEAERRPLDLAPLPDEAEPTPELVQAEAAFEARKQTTRDDRRVYRVPRRHTWAGVAAGLAIGGIAAGVATSVGFAVLPAAAAGALLGGMLGRTRRFYRCSDPECAGRPTSTDTKCPRCGGTIVGDLQGAPAPAQPEPLSAAHDDDHDDAAQ